MTQPDPAPATKLSACRAVALLVDGENIPADLAERMIARTRQRLGVISVLRVYGDAALQTEWARAPSFRFVQAVVGGKSVTDMLIAVEAMELALTGQVDGIALASNDKDFAPLVWTLRQRQIPIIGLGTLEAGLTRFVAGFERIERTMPGAPGSAAVAPAVASVPFNSPDDPGEDDGPLTMPLDILLAIGMVLGSGSLPLTQFGKAMAERGLSKPANSNWRTYLAPLSGYVTISGQGHDARIGLTGAAFNGAAPVQPAT